MIDYRSSINHADPYFLGLFYDDEPLAVHYLIRGGFDTMTDRGVPFKRELQYVTRFIALIGCRAIQLRPAAFLSAPWKSKLN